MVSRSITTYVSSHRDDESLSYLSRLTSASPSLGFGLPHTDEDPYNEPLGNCLGESSIPPVFASVFFHSS